MHTQLSAIEAAANSYCEVAGPSDAEISKVCDYIHTGILTAEAGVNAILNILRQRAARSLQAKAAVTHAANTDHSARDVPLDVIANPYGPGTMSWEQRIASE